MTHDERMGLIARPFPRIHHASHSYPWAGALLSEKGLLQHELGLHIEGAPEDEALDAHYPKEE